MGRNYAEKARTWYSKGKKNGIFWAIRWTALIMYYQIRRALPTPLDVEENNVCEEQWDVLIILDACRTDTFIEIAADLEWITNYDSIWSVGSSSEEWMEQTFQTGYDDFLSECIYVTGNPHSDFAIDKSRFRYVDEVWKYAWDDERGTILPRPLTDRAITIANRDNPERLIVHYMQPHLPPLNGDQFGSAIHPNRAGQAWNDSVWDRLRTGEISENKVRRAYRENLQTVLEEVQLLIQNIEADDIIITSDHGNAFGEFGFYGHDGYLPLRCLREVPWCRTSSRKGDLSGYEPAEYDSAPEMESTKRKLRDLGYLSS